MMKVDAGNRLTSILWGIYSNNSNAATTSDDIDSLGEDQISLIDALSVHAFVSDAIASPINTLGLMPHDLGNRVSFAEVDRYCTNNLRLGQALRYMVNTVYLAGSTKEGGISAEQPNRT